MAVDGFEEDGSGDHERIRALPSVAAYLGSPRVHVNIGPVA
jgi:hypothetical protein